MKNTSLIRVSSRRHMLQQHQFTRVIILKPPYFRTIHHKKGAHCTPNALAVVYVQMPAEKIPILSHTHTNPNKRTHVVDMVVYKRKSELHNN